jgi:hypothetical protein
LGAKELQAIAAIATAPPPKQYQRNNFEIKKNRSENKSTCQEMQN